MQSLIGELESVVAALRAARRPQRVQMAWHVLESQWGTLPADYKEFGELYPSVEFDDLLLVQVPRPGEEAKRLESCGRDLDILRDFVDDGDTEGYVAFPESGGLPPWGSSNQGDSFYWKTAESPEAWTVVVNTANNDWWEFDGGLLSFLVGLFDGSIPAVGLPQGFSSDSPCVLAYP
ncbi:SMI1/KNR4 family protein [Yinghuangia soli]|uniref:SMI1/KNR4 family protein n=1 Tax=Yinghuangia soli TaxID=2908204 RepID=A0AA41PU49_9ACTN|nr:SMI1/KNR4 family protein [Yinghuangia soli]MCF2525746.1 SMI1/KNR4 family protein [Yinghuangia soli]